MCDDDMGQIPTQSWGVTIHLLPTLNTDCSQSVQTSLKEDREASRSRGQEIPAGLLVGMGRDRPVGPDHAIELAEPEIL